MLTIIQVFILLLSLGLFYWFPVRHWFNRWGTTPNEVTSVMPGDKVIANSTNSAMQAVTVATSPEKVWPWLVQMWYQRVACTAMTGWTGCLAFWILQVQTKYYLSFKIFASMTIFPGATENISL